MEASLLYHAVWLVGFYCIVAGCHCLAPFLATSSDTVSGVAKWMLVPLLAALPCALAQDSNRLSAMTCLLLSFAASGLFLTIHWFLDRFLVARRVRNKRNATAAEAVGAMVLILFVVAASSAYMPKRTGMKEWLSVSSLLIVYALSFLHLATLPKRTPFVLPGSLPIWLQATRSHWRNPECHLEALVRRQSLLLAWLLPTLPILLAGDVAVIWFQGEASEYIFLTLVAPILCWLLLCLVLDSLPRSYGQGKLGRLVMLLRLVTVMQGATKVFRLELPHYGMGFASGTVDLFVQMVQLEMLEMLAAWFMARAAAGAVTQV